MRTLRYSLAIAAGLAAMPGFVLAQSATIHSRYNLSVASSVDMEFIQPQQSGVSALDRRFLASMARFHMAEVEFGKLAQKHDTDWPRGYGSDMVRENLLALEEVKKVATDHGISLPDQIDPATQRTLNHLNRMSEAQFAGAYRQMMISLHNGMLPLIDREISSGHCADVRDYAVIAQTDAKFDSRLAMQQTTMMGTANG